MARSLTDAQRNDIVNLYLSGMQSGEIANRLNVGKRTVFRTLKRNGIKARGKRIEMPEGLIEAYENGESVLSLADQHRVSRDVVNRWLNEAGITIRGRSSAGIVRASKMTPEERSAQVAAAHDAVRGSVMSVETRIARALDNERKATAGILQPSEGESLMLGWLLDRGISCTSQKAVWVYNLDIAIGDTLAIEVLGGSWHGIRERRVKDAARLEYLLNSGWNVLYVWNTYYMPISEACADQAVRVLEFARSHPATQGKYWVVRGDGKLTTSARDDADELALVVPSQASQ